MKPRIEFISSGRESERKREICESVLRDLPGWFGIEEATLAYIAGVVDRPMFVAFVEDEVKPIGFLSLVHHNSSTSEIYVIGVKQAFHRQGIGTALVRGAVEYLQEQKNEFLMVKTLGPSHPDEGYRLTRLFYEKVGFRPLEELKELWGRGYPCLLMVRSIKK